MFKTFESLIKAKTLKKNSLPNYEEDLKQLTLLSGQPESNAAAIKTLAEQPNLLAENILQHMLNKDKNRVYNQLCQHTSDFINVIREKPFAFYRQEYSFATYRQRHNYIEQGTFFLMTFSASFFRALASFSLELEQLSYEEIISFYLDIYEVFGQLIDDKTREGAFGFHSPSYHNVSNTLRDVSLNAAPLSSTDCDHISKDYEEFDPSSFSISCCSTPFVFGKYTKRIWTNISNESWDTTCAYDEFLHLQEYDYTPNQTITVGTIDASSIRVSDLSETTLSSSNYIEGLFIDPWETLND